MGTEIPGGGGKGEIIPNATLSPSNDFCIKTGSEDSHLNVSFTARGKVPNVCKSMSKSGQAVRHSEAG